MVADRNRIDPCHVVALLKACAKRKDLHKGTALHAHILENGLLWKNRYVSNSLINMYAKCGALTKAQQLLDSLSFRSTVSWNALIHGYTQTGQGGDALKCFERMKSEGHSPDAITFICILKACGSIGAADKGTEIHDAIVNQGLLASNTTLGNSLLSMYVKCHELAKAQHVFSELPVQNVVSWSILMAGYAEQGHGEDALFCFEQMQQEGLLPNAITLTWALKACGSIRAFDKGKQIHEVIVKQDLLGKDVILGCALVDMYSKCGVLEEAEHALDIIPVRDVVAWSAIITGYAQQEQGGDALHCFARMQHEGLSPDAVTYTCILKACGSIRAADKGEEVHSSILKQGLLGKSIVLGTALVDMYAKCGSLVKAQQVLHELVFKDCVAWSALITGYVLEGYYTEALNCFELMYQHGLFLDAITFTCILKACGSIGALEKGETIHNEVVRKGLLADSVVLGNILVDMYVRCGALGKAQQALDGLMFRDVVSWSAVIGGYAQQGHSEDALNYFDYMHLEGISPNIITMIWILKACGNLGAAVKGGQIHKEITRQGLLEKEGTLASALIDMYTNCGSLAEAQQMIDELPVRDAVSWSALISGYAHQGLSREVLNYFSRMQQEGFPPSAVTLACVLNACSHSGLLAEGQMYFDNMNTKHGIQPDEEHQTCMVDLFGRAGAFDKVMAMVLKMSPSNCIQVWRALIGACQKWGEIKLGRWAFDNAIQIDKRDTASYICMANIYSAAGMYEDAEVIEIMRVQNEACNESEISWCELM